MKLCYFDESGTGSEPIAVVVGVIVDAQRMHITKREWADLLLNLSNVVGSNLDELHTKDFYPGNKSFRSMTGLERAMYVSQIIDWLSTRKHKFVYSAVNKAAFESLRSESTVGSTLTSPYQAAAFHCILAVQKTFQREEKSKGHTLLVFDKKGHEEPRLASLLANPPDWIDTFYQRKKKSDALSHIIDTPYFADSKHVPMIQVADFLSYFLRRYAEVKEGHGEPKYNEEKDKLETWISALSPLALQASNIYPQTKRGVAAEFSYQICPQSLRSLAR